VVKSSGSFRFGIPPPIFFLMMSLLRRSRAMALAMVLLAPGITGSAVQWLHACPAQAAVVADHQHHDQAPADAGHPQLSVYRLL
jgi:membrane protein YqaA with SNARE-associated domain